MATHSWRMPRRIETERLVLRCYTLEDARAMDAVIPANRDHLVTFLPWATSEPVSPEVRRDTVRTFMEAFEQGTDFTLGIFDRTSGEYLGGTGFHLREQLPPDVLEIGYWLSADAQGRGLISEASAALTWVALGHLEATAVQIRCEPDNVRSRAVPERLGYTWVETASDDAGIPMEVWRMTSEDFAASRAASYPVPHIGDLRG